MADFFAFGWRPTQRRDQTRTSDLMLEASRAERTVSGPALPLRPCNATAPSTCRHTTPCSRSCIRGKGHKGGRRGSAHEEWTRPKPTKRTLPEPHNTAQYWFNHTPLQLGLQASKHPCALAPPFADPKHDRRPGHRANGTGLQEAHKAASHVLWQDCMYEGVAIRPQCCPEVLSFGTIHGRGLRNNKCFVKMKR